MKAKTRRILAVLLMLCLVLPAVPASAASGDLYQVEVTGYIGYTEIYEELELLNAYRIENDLAPLTLDVQMTEAAMQRAAEIAIYYDASHDRANGQPWHSMPSMHGNSKGENIAYGYMSVESVMNAWKNSKGHNENMLGEKYKSVGLGFFKDKNNNTYWTQDFSSDAGTALSQSTQSYTGTKTVEVVEENIHFGSSPAEPSVAIGATAAIDGAIFNYGAGNRATVIHLSYVESLTPDIASAELDSDGAVVVTGLAKGTAKLRVGLVKENGKGAFVFDLPVKVTGFSMEEFTVDTSSEVYNGSAHRKDVKSSLVYGKDYTVSYRNNVNAGVATVVITGMGDYEGTLEYNFVIEKAERRISADISNKLYLTGYPTATITVHDNAGSGGAYAYASSNENVAKVSRRGEISAIAPGYATITIAAQETENYKAGSIALDITVYESMASGKPTETTSPTEPFHRTFTDVLPNMFYAVPVEWAVKEGVTTGATATTFAPDNTCTQCQILTFLYRAADSPDPMIDNPYSSPYVYSTAYYYDAMLWAYQEGVVTNRALDPNAPCTRSDVVTYLWRLAGSQTAGTQSFEDVPAGAAYAKAVSWAVANGITNGVNGAGTKFGPSQTCTRGQIVTFLYRYFVKSLNG